MTYKIIDEKCTRCNDCLSVCPVNAIYIREKGSRQGSEGSYGIYLDICTGCIGSYDKPECIRVCAVDDCIVKDVDYNASRDDLIELFQRTIGFDDEPKRCKGITLKGKRCRNSATRGSYCVEHQNQDPDFIDEQIEARLSQKRSDVLRKIKDFGLNIVVSLAFISVMLGKYLLMPALGFAIGYWILSGPSEATINNDTLACRADAEASVLRSVDNDKKEASKHWIAVNAREAMCMRRKGYKTSYNQLLKSYSYE